jgi:hypothetical protein
VNNKTKSSIVHALFSLSQLLTVLLALRYARHLDKDDQGFQSQLFGYYTIEGATLQLKVAHMNEVLLRLIAHISEPFGETHWSHLRIHVGCYIPLASLNSP